MKMEIGFILTSALLILFGLLALYDGLYLHILKYRLHEHKDSKTEHLTHTLRAILFPGILYFLFLGVNAWSFYIGVALVALDVIILGLDAYYETDSRKFMGGLPRWEYILHLFVNGFHFASIAVFLALRVNLDPWGLTIVNNFTSVAFHETFAVIVKNLIPGGILMAALHLVLTRPAGAKYFNTLRSKLSCC